MNAGKILITVGLLSLIHAGYSAAQLRRRVGKPAILRDIMYDAFSIQELLDYRSFLRLTEQAFHHLPADIIVQTLLSLIVTICGVTSVAGHFKEIRATTELESKSFEAIGNRPSFYTFSHRGRVLTSI